MNKYIKHIVEAFDFDSVNKQKKSINIYDEIYKYNYKILQMEKFISIPQLLIIFFLLNPLLKLKIVNYYI